MAYISKIEMSDFMGMGNLTWNLDANVNILGGTNGSGKSTIFRLCYILLNQEHLKEKEEYYLSKLVKHLYITLSDGWSLEWKILEEMPSKAEDIVGSYRGTDFLDGEGAYDQVTIVRDPEGTVCSFENIKTRIEVYLINSFEQRLSDALKFNKQYSSSIHDDQTMLDIMIKNQIDLRNGKLSEAMEKYIGETDDDVEARNKYMQQYRMVYGVLHKFLQNYVDSFNSKFDFEKEGQKFGYEHLSMGEKQILLLLLMVANTNGQPCVFFMDEPDLSMHIDWKEQLVTCLHELNPRMQIILSTHAPSVITGWMDRVQEVSQLIQK